MSYEYSEGYKIRDQGAPHFLTFTVVGWIDIFSRQRYRDIMLKNFAYCRQNKGLLIGAYVIMSNHIHLIAQSKQDCLSATIRDLKSFSTKEIISTIESERESRKEWLNYMFAYHAKRTNQNKDFKLWQSGNHPEVITGHDFMMTKLDYIHQNPVRADIVAEAEQYLYSSASNYSTGKGLIEIDYLY